MLLLTLRGTPLVYYGDEIGMTDVTVPPEQAVDPDGRDPVRTPMQWDPGPAAGFSTGEPWLPVPAGARIINVAAEDHDCGSLLNLYRRLLSVRRDEPALTVGSYIALHTNGEVLAYRREHQGRRILLVLNFGDQPAAIELPDAAGGQILISTDPHRVTGDPAVPLILTATEGLLISATTERSAP